MRSTAVIAAVALTLTACGQRSETAAPAPVETAAVSTASVSNVEASAPAALKSVDLRRVCHAGLAAIHGQQLQDIQIDGLEGQIVNASWRAPVDGGRRKALCRVDSDVVTWKSVEATNPEQARWMNQPGDPVSRFVLDGNAITINTTLPDGTTASETHSVAAEQEAR